MKNACMEACMMISKLSTQSEAERAHCMIRERKASNCDRLKGIFSVCTGTYLYVNRLHIQVWVAYETL